MANDQLILQINKVSSSVDNRRLKYNQAERGRAIDVTVIDNDGSSAYDLTGKTLIFTEDKIENKIIVDSSDSLGSQSGKFIRTDENDKAGKFTYVFTDIAMQQSGEACFEFVTDSKHIDVSSSFFIDIQATGALAPENTSYVSDMEAFKAHYNAIINNADAQIKSVTDRLSNALDSAIASGNATLQEKIKSYSDQFDQYLKDFDAAKAQNLEDLQNLKDKIAETETDAISKIVDGTNQQIQQANDKLNAKLSELQDDYDDWKVQTVKDFNATVDPIKQSIDANRQNLDGVTKSVKDTIAQMQSLQTELNKVDFTKFAQLSDLTGYYTKDQVDELLKTDVKSVTVNGGEKFTPDESGNLALPVPDPDLSDFVHKSELVPKADKTYVDSKIDAIDFGKIKFRMQYVTGDNKTADSTWQATKNADGTYTIDLYHDDWTAQRVVDLLNQIGGKANASDVNSLQDLINQQNQTIQSLTTRLTNAENEIKYIQDNYIEGRRFPASQEAQAEAWENEKPTRLAMIEK
ncbi:hypothetical protein FC52_GL000838 [Lactobacillus pasteurii DSM 23907 = CRBIP 24.76]|uniref:BppU N-terminal domain-containing protein n=1 Tax=Lactobacillus pasteurii DSM 23907 = CRBIP 24.76 TaxID=1423790 RepID=I7LB59_9LACO|nr:hypothetical protein [Lactobacillus pasteurii]KRK07245.1 hypothetical protein FC52_GL000838 [Lactobacillus pasteurii DSM 23907 = CRBIP 24.76]TDG76624.1 hypothetical protein C5L33_001383 [Lactobacillus pasteurii]CCI85281.1 Predicted protein [Lactobacillus pasteurii DSM 23907 = CRBIP 24.76]